MSLFDLFSSGEPKTQHRTALEKIENKLDQIMLHLQIPMPDTGGLPTDIQRLVDQNRKIEAIKEYRERFEVGLKEAKDAVDSGGEQAGTALFRIESRVDAILKQLGIEEAVAESEPVRPIATMTDVEDYIRRGDKIGAIRIYRETTTSDLKEAKDAVDEMERQMRNR